jgi:hypothetical protein
MLHAHKSGFIQTVSKKLMIFRVAYFGSRIENQGARFERPRKRKHWERGSDLAHGHGETEDRADNARIIVPFDVVRASGDSNFAGTAR